MRVMAWIFRFIRNIRRAHQSSGELASSEFTQARLHCIKDVEAELDALNKKRLLPQRIENRSVQPVSR